MVPRPLLTEILNTPLQGLLYGAENDLLVTAKLLVTIKIGGKICHVFCNI